MSAHALPSPRSGLRRLRPLARRSDDELRALAAGGDAGAFAELYERHHQALYRYCRSIVRHDEDARDALHSTWTNAWAALRSADRDVPVRPWLFRIAHNEAVSVLRRRRDHDDLDDVAGAASSGAVEDDVALRQRLSTLRADLAELPERQRSALLLRELSGLGHDEIAAVHGVSAAAAKQSIYEARRALQEAEEGRSMTCADVQRLLSDGDGRVRRGRRVRAHLRTCDSCAGFEVALRRRPADIALLAPPLPAAASAGLLASFLAHVAGAGHGGGAVASAGTAAVGMAPAATGSAASAVTGATGTAATGGGVSAASGGLLAAGSKLGAGLAAKLAVGAVVVAGAGAGTVELATHDRHATVPPASVPAAQPPAPAAASAGAASMPSANQPGARVNATKADTTHGRASADHGHAADAHATRTARGDDGSTRGNGSASVQDFANGAGQSRQRGAHAGGTRRSATHPTTRAKRPVRTTKRAKHPARTTQPAHAPKPVKHVPSPTPKPAISPDSGSTTDSGSKTTDPAPSETTSTPDSTTSADTTAPDAGASSSRNPAAPLLGRASNSSSS